MVWKPTVTIDDVEIPRPDNGWSQTISDLSDDQSGTNLDGTTEKSVIGTQSSIPFKYLSLEWEVAASLCNAIDGKSSMMIKYPDIRHPYTTIEKKVYVGNRKCELKENHTDGKVHWSLEFDVITMDGEG